MISKYLKKSKELIRINLTNYLPVLNLSFDFTPTSEANIASRHATVQIPQIVCDACTIMLAY